MAVPKYASKQSKRFASFIGVVFPLGPARSRPTPEDLAFQRLSSSYTLAMQQRNVAFSVSLRLTMLWGSMVGT